MHSFKDSKLSSLSKTKIPQNLLPSILKDTSKYAKKVFLFSKQTSLGGGRNSVSDAFERGERKLSAWDSVTNEFLPPPFCSLNE